MASASPPTSLNGVDLESVLSVGRRTLTSIGEASSSLQQRHTDMIYVKREDHCNSLFSIDSKIVIFGDLQFLYAIFERHTSNISIQEEGNQSPSNRTSFSMTSEENEEIGGDETENDHTSPIISKLRQTSLSSASSSPPKVIDIPTRRPKLNSLSRSHTTTTSTASDYSPQNLEGKRYGSIQVPNMTIIEILEVLFRMGLELVNQFSHYDKENVLHQSFIFIQIRSTGQRLTQSSYSRTMSLIGT